MKKIISTISSSLIFFAAIFSISTVAKSAEFFTIGTGGPTGVYFQTGNAICKMLHKSAISAEHGSCLLYTSPSPRDLAVSRMPSSA